MLWYTPTCAIRIISLIRINLPLNNETDSLIPSVSITVLTILLVIPLKDLADLAGEHQAGITVQEQEEDIQVVVVIIIILVILMLVAAVPLLLKMVSSLQLNLV